EAVHRLAELGLVHARQGGSTVVLDPRESADLRVIDLAYRLGPSTAKDVLDFTERQALNGHVLLYLAERHASKSDRERLAAIALEYAQAGAPESELHAFEERFWREVARATKNRICLFEVNWWFRLVGDHPRARHAITAPERVRAAVLSELARRLASGDDAAGYYLEVAGKMIDHVELGARRAGERRRR
ncbi:MAG TPA: hypothetical protein VJ891_01250, partial [Casimicrobiaceae bacterium]|nr:hypothetical protein [Casimicrobiaceae bacterium]